MRIEDKFLTKREIIDLQVGVKELQNLIHIKKDNEDLWKETDHFRNDFSVFETQMKEKMGNIEKDLSKFVVTGKLI